MSGLTSEEEGDIFEEEESLQKQVDASPGSITTPPQQKQVDVVPPPIRYTKLAIGAVDPKQTSSTSTVNRTRRIFPKDNALSQLHVVQLHYIVDREMCFMDPETGHIDVTRTKNMKAFDDNSTLRLEARQEIERDYYYQIGGSNSYLESRDAAMKGYVQQRFQRLVDALMISEYKRMSNKEMLKYAMTFYTTQNAMARIYLDAFTKHYDSKQVPNELFKYVMKQKLIFLNMTVDINEFDTVFLREAQKRGYPHRRTIEQSIEDFLKDDAHKRMFLVFMETIKSHILILGRLLRERFKQYEIDLPKDMCPDMLELILQFKPRVQDDALEKEIIGEAKAWVYQTLFVFRTSGYKRSHYAWMKQLECFAYMINMLEITMLNKETPVTGKKMPQSPNMANLGLAMDIKLAVTAYLIHIIRIPPRCVGDMCAIMIGYLSTRTSTDYLKSVEIFNTAIKTEDSKWLVMNFESFFEHLAHVQISNASPQQSTDTVNKYLEGKKLAVQERLRALTRGNNVALQGTKFNDMVDLLCIVAANQVPAWSFIWSVYYIPSATLHKKIGASVYQDFCNYALMVKDPQKILDDQQAEYDYTLANFADMDEQIQELLKQMEGPDPELANIALGLGPGLEDD